MKGLTNNINKEFILRNISQIEIIEHYTNISELEIQNCIKYNTLINSPFRVDPIASIGFRYDNRNKLKMKDFGGFFWGDCFDVVCKVLNANPNIKTKLSVNNKEDFKYIIHHIANEFNLLKGVPLENKPTSINIQKMLINIKKQMSVIDVELREWGYSCDKYHWLVKYHNIIDYKTLEDEYIFPVERYWINYNENPEPKYYFTSNDPCYAYYEGKLNGINLIRLYFPARSRKEIKEPKFISNNQVLQRVHSLQGKYDKIIIIKSKKDAIILDKLLQMSNIANTPSFSFTGNFRIGIIAYPQESYKITNNIIKWLLENHLYESDISNIITFLDFDKAGIKSTRYSFDKYGILYLFLTNGLLGLPNYGAKDISDYLEKNGIDKTLEIINNFTESWINKKY